MKRVFSILLTSFILINSIFAKGFFDERYFEIRADVPIDISNNAFSLNEILVKDLVIDLKKISDEMPKSGFTTIVNLNPSISTNLNIAGFSAGTRVGLNGYLKINLSKDIFEFLGYGYKGGDELNVELKPVVDLFAFAEVPVSFKISKYKFKVMPSVFLPIATVDNCTAKVSLTNDDDGNVSAQMVADLNLYTSPLFDILNGTEDVSEINIQDSMGFDLGASFEMPLIEDLNLRIDGRIPLMPGRLYNSVNMKYSYDFSTNLMETIMPGELNDGTSSGETKNELSDSGSPEGKKLEEPYYIHRPLKLNGYVIYNPVSFVTLVAGGGLGIRHPFGDGFYCYPEYYASVSVSLAKILKATVSTEYTDQLFRHQLMGTVNLRVFELNTGISLQSGSFLQSFNAAGFGAKIGVALGF